MDCFLEEVHLLGCVRWLALCHYNRGRARWPFYPLKSSLLFEWKVKSLILQIQWCYLLSEPLKQKYAAIENISSSHRSPGQEHCRVINSDLLLYLVRGFFRLITKCDMVSKWGGESQNSIWKKTLKVKQKHTSKWEGICSW